MGSNGDFNSLTTPGMYRVDANWSNGPSSYSHGQVLVVRGAGDTVGQLVFPHTESMMHLRTGNPLASANNNPTWRNWTTIGSNAVVERRSASFSSIAAGGNLEVKMNLAKTGYNGIPGYAYTCTKVVVNNIYNQNTANDGRVVLMNLGTSAQAGTVFVYMIYIRT